jgi:8-oxo-dGTP diphosphatase
MQKGVDYIGVNVAFYCHDGEGNYLFHQRSDKCRDEHGRWDCGGGSVEFGETSRDAVKREVQEEFGTEPLDIEFLGFAEVFREHKGVPTQWVAFRYRVLVDRDKVINNEPEKHTELRWCRLDDLPSPLHSMIESELEEYKEKLI